MGPCGYIYGYVGVCRAMYGYVGPSIYLSIYLSMRNMAKARVTNASEDFSIQHSCFSSYERRIPWEDEDEMA